jgi:hypothetical protein
MYESEFDLALLLTVAIVGAVVCPERCVPVPWWLRRWQVRRRTRQTLLQYSSKVQQQSTATVPTSNGRQRLSHPF